MNNEKDVRFAIGTAKAALEGILDHINGELYKKDSKDFVVGDIINRPDYRQLRVWRKNKPGGWTLKITTDGDTEDVKYFGDLNKDSRDIQEPLPFFGEAVVLDKGFGVYGFEQILETEEWWNATCKAALETMESLKAA